MRNQHHTVGATDGPVADPGNAADIYGPVGPELPYEVDLTHTPGPEPDKKLQPYDGPLTKSANVPLILGATMIGIAFILLLQKIAK